PAARADSGVGSAEFARRHGDYAMVGLAACARADGKRLENLRLAYFGVGPTPVRARNAEPVLADGDIEGAVSTLARDLDPPDDMHASGAVKTHLAGVLLRRGGRPTNRGPARTSASTRSRSPSTAKRCANASMRARRWSTFCARTSRSPAAMSAASMACAAPAVCAWTVSWCAAA